ncbi:MAG: D-sedoheptulose 7-phosphate isomerase [Patescibacteria group bacterium]|nr:D-sedoheptulose 7-phosphate isomerase [Patescibacteria group bacterium]
MKTYIEKFADDISFQMKNLPAEEIAKATHIIQSVYERDGRIYVFGNGGSLALATHWVSDFNKTVFSHNLDANIKRFQAIRLPSTESEITAWANDVGFDMIFAGPLKNYLQETDCLIAISSSGNSPNIIKAVELAKSHHVPVIGISGFDGGKLNELADAKIVIKTEKGAYAIVESVHGAILHLFTSYFQDYFDHIVKRDEKHKK